MSISAQKSSVLAIVADDARGNQAKTSPLPSVTAVQNQNRTETKNAGDDQQLQTELQEQEGTESGRGENLESRSQVAIEHMSVVATRVQELLQLKTTGGIGDQVREIAREQNQAQEQIGDQLDKIDAKNQVAKFFFGPDFVAIRQTRQQLEQNQARIAKLEQLMTQIVNKADQEKIKSTIEALIQQNTILQERINTEDGSFSLFGWLVRLFPN